MFNSSRTVPTYRLDMAACIGPNARVQSPISMQPYNQYRLSKYILCNDDMAWESRQVDHSCAWRINSYAQVDEPIMVTSTTLGFFFWVQ